MLRIFIAAVIATSCASTTSPSAVAPAPVAAAEPEGHHEGGSHDWNDTYREGTGFNQKPNALLVSVVKSRPSGTALDVGMGQGRNAVFMATQGWAVTGVDTADEGIRIAKEHAAAAKVPLKAIVGDADTFEMGTGKYDLIALMYVGGAGLSERVKAALKSGGVVVVEYFHKDMEAQFHHPMGAFGTGELEGLFSGYKVLRSEVVEDLADFGEKKAKLVRFVAQKP